MPLIFQATAVARPQYYDRNPAVRSAYYISTLVPHALTQRWQYQCPLNKKAFIEEHQAFVSRAAAAGAVGEAVAVVVYTPNGGSNVFLQRAYIGTNGVFDHDQVNNTQFGMMQVGDLISGFSSDSSAGGQTTMALSFKGVEFDA